MCLGDLNSPGNSAKFDTAWGKIFSFEKESLIDNLITSHDDNRIKYIAYGFRNPWSCFFHNNESDHSRCWKFSLGRGEYSEGL